MGNARTKIEARVSLVNKKAGFEFELLDCFTAGIMLRGTEIKSIRQSKVNMGDAYCVFKGLELFVVNLHISAYEAGTYNNHQPLAERKLLLNRQELRKLNKQFEEKGLTIIPRKLFINDRGLAKLEVCLAKGKKLHDKRDSIKEKDVKREMARTVEKY